MFVLHIMLAMQDYADAAMSSHDEYIIQQITDFHSSFDSFNLTNIEFTIRIIHSPPIFFYW